MTSYNILLKYIRKEYTISASGSISIKQDSESSGGIVLPTRVVLLTLSWRPDLITSPTHDPWINNECIV